MRTRLETQRLILRPLEPDDLPALTALHAEPSFWWYPLRRGQTEAETEALLARMIDIYESSEPGMQAVVDRRSGELAGWAGLATPNFLPQILPAVEIGWRLGSAWRGRGYATEAASAWVRWAFEDLQLDRLVSIYEFANVPSGRVMEKLGFELDLITTIPGSQIEAHVTALSSERWRDLCREGRWPATA